LGERIVFLGRVPEAKLPLLYAGALACVNASLLEGYGLPVLEAMACGAPVACAEAPGLAEAAGDAALFFNPQNLDSIAEALKKISTDSTLRANVRARGLARAQTQTWAHVAEATLKVYADAITNNQCDCSGH
jgi:alpha-1,3-rhamnosyl/mannosyltransferase